MESNQPASNTSRLSATFAGRRVLVTGHTGFKGSWLCEWLLSLGAEIYGFSLLQHSSDPSLFDQLSLATRLHDQRGDIRDSDSIKHYVQSARPDFVFHLAAQPLVRLSYAEPVQTYQTNVLGTINVLEALRTLTQPCAAVLITTDKVYENREWFHGYRECDPLGGHDPYSSSKAACEIAISSWRNSFFKNHPVSIATARAGNVIGGGDWALDRIVPDSIRALQQGQPVPVRNKISTRPWQHVLEPLGGYLTLAAHLVTEIPTPSTPSTLQSAFNFGPRLDSNRTVKDLVEETLKHWPGTWDDRSDPHAVHEAGKLNLVWDKAFHLLGWQPRWDFETTLRETIHWYKAVNDGADPVQLTQQQINAYQAAI